MKERSTLRMIPSSIASILTASMIRIIYLSEVKFTVQKEMETLLLPQLGNGKEADQTTA